MRLLFVAVLVRVFGGDVLEAADCGEGGAETDLTLDEIDAILAGELGYTELLPALEHGYYCVDKPTGDRPGTLRYDPSKTMEG